MGEYKKFMGGKNLKVKENFKIFIFILFHSKTFSYFTIFCRIIQNIFLRQEKLFTNALIPEILFPAKHSQTSKNNHQKENSKAENFQRKNSACFHRRRKSF